MGRRSAIAACLALAACSEGGKPTDDMCLAAADNLVALFSENDASVHALGRRAAERSHRNFFESCRDTGTIEQARCASEATSVAELERCH